MLQEWIPDTVWLDIIALSATDALRDLADSVTRSDAAWHAWYDSEAPERAVIPDFQTRISKFTRMCIVKVCPPAHLSKSTPSVVGHIHLAGWHRHVLGSKTMVSTQHDSLTMQCCLEQGSLTVHCLLLSRSANLFVGPSVL